MNQREGLSRDELLARTFRVQVIVALAIFLSLVIWFIIEETIRFSFRPFYGLAQFGSRQLNQIVLIRYIFYGLSVLTVIIMRTIHSSRTKISSDLEFRQALSKLSNGNIILMTLAEIPAILGFIFFLLTGYQRDFYVLAAISVILMFMYFPRRAFWEEKLRSLPPER